MATRVDINNILYDDQLISLIKENFNKDDMNLFDLNYKIYIANKDNINDFIVNFDEVYKWIGFSRKDPAKRLLESKNKENKHLFEINKDYIIKMNTPTTPPMGGVKKSISSEKKEIILLTINCFKKFCLKASTEKADKIYDYYIKMEEIITKYIENKHKEIIDENNNKEILLQLKDTQIEENNKILQLKDNQIEENIIMLQLKDHEIENSHKKLQLKDQEIDNKDKLLEETLTNLQIKDIEIKNLKNQTYEEIDKNNHIYIFTTDKPNIFKCGRTNDIKKRKASLQTGNVDNIITLTLQDSYLRINYNIYKRINYIYIINEN